MSDDPPTTDAPPANTDDPADSAGNHDLDQLRAQAATAATRAEELAQRLAQTEQTLTHTREALDAAEQRNQIDRLLAEADAADLETARLLTEAAIAQMDEPDIAAAIAGLRQRKPFLFARPTTPAPSGPMGPAGPHDPTAHLHNLAVHAAATGDRIALIEYLRARRTARAAG